MKHWQHNSNLAKPKSQEPKELQKIFSCPHIWHSPKLGRLKQIRSWNISYKINSKGNGQLKKRTKPKLSLTRNQKTKNGTQIEKKYLKNKKKCHRDNSYKIVHKKMVNNKKPFEPMPRCKPTTKRGRSLKEKEEERKKKGNENKT